MVGGVVRAQTWRDPAAWTVDVGRRADSWPGATGYLQEQSETSTRARPRPSATGALHGGTLTGASQAFSASPTTSQEYIARGCRVGKTTSKSAEGNRRGARLLDAVMAGVVHVPAAAATPRPPRRWRRWTKSIPPMRRIQIQFVARKGHVIAMVIGVGAHPQPSPPQRAPLPPTRRRESAAAG